MFWNENWEKLQMKENIIWFLLMNLWWNFRNVNEKKTNRGIKLDVRRKWTDRNGKNQLDVTPRSLALCKTRGIAAGTLSLAQKYNKAWRITLCARPTTCLNSDSDVVALFALLLQRRTGFARYAAYSDIRMFIKTRVPGSLQDRTRFLYPCARSCIFFH